MRNIKRELLSRSSNARKQTAVHPGDVLMEKFLKPNNLSQNHLAIQIRVPARRINEIVLHKRRLTADTALRLAKYFGVSARFWMGLQMDYDLDKAADELAEKIERDVQQMTV